MGEMKNTHKILVGNVMERYHLGYLAVDVTIISERILTSKCRNMEWIHLRQDRDRWRALVNTVMNIRVP
jgi:hypothetical protein